MKRCFVSAVCALGSTAVFASLPPPTPQQAEAAALAKAKTAHADKVGAYKLCLAINAVAGKYRTAGTPPPGPCADPGPFVPPTTTAAAPAAPAPAAAPVKK